MNTGVGAIIQPLTQSSQRKCGFSTSEPCDTVDDDNYVQMSKASLIIFMMTLALSPPTALAADHPTSFSDACTRLSNNNGVIVSSAGIESAAFGPGNSCVVHGKITSSAISIINFRVDLPDPASWNGKLLMIGGAGFDGFVPTDAPTILGFGPLRSSGATPTTSQHT